MSCETSTDNVQTILLRCPQVGRCSDDLGGNLDIFQLGASGRLSGRSAESLLGTDKEVACQIRVNRSL
jgi:hypothetical protein